MSITPYDLYTPYYMYNVYPLLIFPGFHVLLKLPYVLCFICGKTRSASVLKTSRLYFCIGKIQSASKKRLLKNRLLKNSLLIYTVVFAE